MVSNALRTCWARRNSKPPPPATSRSPASTRTRLTIVRRLSLSDPACRISVNQRLGDEDAHWIGAAAGMALRRTRPGSGLTIRIGGVDRQGQGGRQPVLLFGQFHRNRAALDQGIQQAL